MTQGITINTLFQIAAKIATTGTTFLLSLILAFYLGPSGYGDFTKVVTLVTILYVVLDFGFNALFLQEKEEISFNTLLTTRIISAFGLFMILNILVALLPYDVLTGIGFSSEVKFGTFIFSFSLFAQGVLQSCSALFQERRQYSHLFYAIAFGSLVTLLALFFGVALQVFTLQLGLAALTLGGFGGAFAAYIFVKESITFSFNTPQVKKLIVKSLPLGLMLVCNLVYFRADMIVLSLLKSSFDVGVYGLSFRIFEFLVSLPLFLSNSLYPHFLDAEKNNRNSHTHAKKYIFLSTIGAVIISGIFWIIAPYLLYIDKDFYYAIIPLRILLVFLPVFFITSILQWVLIAKRQQKFLLFPYLGVGIINILLNIIFIPQFSYVASAVITGMSEVLILIMLSGKLLFFTKNMEKGASN